jgi:hypothetical protein
MEANTWSGSKDENLLKDHKDQKEDAHGGDVPGEHGKGQHGTADGGEEYLRCALDACRRKASTCAPGVPRSYMEYELNYIDDQLCHLKERMESFLASTHGENEKRGRELRQENTLFLRYLIIKEYFFGGYESSQRGA